MLYKVFNFKSLKIVLGKTDNNEYIGYSVDTKYPEYSRAIIRGSAKEIVEVCIYLYKSRLLTAYNCENYEWDIYGNYAGMFLEDAADDWVAYVLNRYLFEVFNIQYEHHYEMVNHSWIAHDGTLCTCDDYRYKGIIIKHW